MPNICLLQSHMSADMSDSVKYIESGTGYGEITIVMPDGEILSGEYTTGRAIN